MDVLFMEVLGVMEAVQMRHLLHICYSNTLNCMLDEHVHRSSCCSVIVVCNNRCTGTAYCVTFE